VVSVVILGIAFLFAAFCFLLMLRGH